VSSTEEGWVESVVVDGQGEIREVALAYKESDLYVSVETVSDPTTWIGDALHLVIYASGRAGDEANTVSRYAGEQLGFGLSRAAQVNFDKLRPDGAGVVAVYSADGDGGWRFSSSIASTPRRAVQVAERIELMVPFDEIGVEPGQSTTMVVTLERDGQRLGRAPDQPMLASIPTLIQGEQVFATADPAGDDHGPGGYVYPTNQVFDTDGLFDLIRYAVYDAEDRWQLALEFTALPNPWNGPQGFSHPIVNLYFDVAQGGSTEMHEEGAAAKVRFDPTHPWDVFLRVTGWPAYGRHLWTASGEGPILVEVASDPKRGRIIVTIPKSVLPEIAGWHYVLVGSQDGYGANYFRPVGGTAGEWAGGGNPDPFVAPLAYDVLAPPGTTQEVILSSFDSTERSFATLHPIEVELASP
jgi:carbohydrate-binding DOMON domain-containing protein